MPRGGARTGAGRKPKPLIEHLARGTYRPARHGPRPANVLPMPVPVSPWTPTATDLAGIGPAGLALLTRTLDTFEPTVLEGVQLLEAARAADVLEQLRAMDAPDLRQVRLWSAYFTATIRMLGLT